MNDPGRPDLLDPLRLELYNVFVAAGVERGEATVVADAAYRGHIGSLTTAELLLELKGRLGDVRVSAPGTLGDLVDVLLRGLTGERLVYRVVVP